MSFTLATRQNLILLLGVVSKSGGGKTLSALMLARGLVGPKGRIKAIDSENGRMRYHADNPAVAPFDVAEIAPPYTPDAYSALIDEGMKDADVLVIDSLSHEWNGEGGCLAMVDQVLDKKCGQDWNARDRFKMFAWGQVTPKHDLFVAKLCRSPIPIICCFRAKDKIVMEKEEPAAGQQRGKTTIRTDEDAPVQRKDLVHEMTMIFQLEQQDGVGGFYTVRKRTTEGLYQAFVGAGDKQISVKHGQALAAWCKAPAAASNPPQSPAGGPTTTPASGAATSGSGKKPATAKTREWMFGELKGYEPTLLKTFFEQKGWIAPFENLADLPLHHVATSKEELRKLMGAIEKFKETGSV